MFQFNQFCFIKHTYINNDMLSIFVIVEDRLFREIHIIETSRNNTINTNFSYY